MALMTVQVRILGRTQVLWGGRDVDLGPERRRTVLAALAVDVGRPVPVDDLIERVWGDDPPAAARSNLYSYLTRLRRTFAGAGIPRSALHLLSRAGGYQMDMDPGGVDLHRFRTLTARAREEPVDDGNRAAVLDEALALWQRTPLADLRCDWAATTRQALEPQRIEAIVSWTRAQLRLGRTGAMIERLRELSRQHPLVEPLAAGMIEALHQEGRSAEALAWYAATRQYLHDELGVEPGEELRRLHSGILNGELAGPTTGPTPAPSGWRRPAQLPLDAYGFVGRARELDSLDALLEATDRQPTATIIAAPSGPAGIGKSALAVHWAHRVADRFPDGQLHVDLRGSRPAAPPPVGAVIRAFLDALGVPAAEVPSEVDQLSACLRSALAGRRVLFVLDDAASADQVRALLPGLPGCLVVVTGRDPLVELVALDGARPLPLDTLSTSDARELLVHRLGRDRVRAEPGAVTDLILAGGGVPVVLASVAARASVAPRRPLADFVMRPTLVAV
jgi:DNA-binding SARP family transcriptional activator